jgi:hypothetical protein
MDLPFRAALSPAPTAGRAASSPAPLAGARRAVGPPVARWPGCPGEGALRTGPVG